MSRAREPVAEPGDRSGRGGPESTGAVSPDSFSRDRRTVVGREKERHGGVKVGSAFFGWLTATGTALLLTALLAAAGTAVGLATNTGAGEAANSATQATKTIDVAGRMARFNGMKQGIAVWVWALLIATIVAGLSAVAGDKFNVLARLNSFPRIPISEGALTTGGILTALAVAAASLIGAILGGLAGMRFHRKVDKAGLGQ